jgi:hypothetical protein
METDASGGAVKKIFSRRVAICAGVMVFALFLARPSASRLQDRVARSISAALGRNVEIGSLHVRFLPRPGFDLENVVIHDDARFGAEPLVRAPEVTAWLQVGALLKGHIQIAHLNLSDASLNLTRNAAGEWNLADLIQRSSAITVAPTSAGRHTAAKAFPYIEASNARVNLKIGEEKTHFALTDAKFALWQDSENTWGVRIEAQPIRTDANLTDTGLLAINGTWQRSATLLTTPLHFSFAWRRAQLGQLTKLVSGVDREWRGAVALSGELVGTPENLKIASETSVDDFRGPDVMGDGDLRLAARCTAEYRFSSRAVSNLDCVAPSGGGKMELTGSAAAGRTLVSAYDLQLSVTGLATQSILGFARHMKTTFAGDITAQGLTSGTVQLTRDDAGSVRIQGSGELRDLTLLSRSNGSLAIGTIPFGINQGTHEQEQRPRTSSVRRGGPQAQAEIGSLQAEIGPFDLATGKGSSLQIRSSVSRSGYEGSIRGEAHIRELLQLARVVAVPVPAVNADGNSSVDLRIAGAWDGARPAITGSAQLRSVYAQVRGLNGPLNISRASMNLSEDSVKVSNLTAEAADATWHGSLRIPRPCANPASCALEFNLHTAKLSAAGLNQYLNAALQKKSWYRFLGLGEDQPGYLMQARASGTVAIEQLMLGNTPCSNFSATLRLDKGRISLSSITGEVLDGSISGDWEANFNASPPEYKGSGTAQGITLAQVSELMQNNWIEGAADARYEFAASGRSLRELLASADMGTQFSISDSVFPHVALTKGSGPLRAQSFSGTAQMHDGEISFRDAELETARRVYSLSGTASLAGALNLRISSEGAPGYSVSGTILETRVSASPTTAAALKP